MRLDESLGWRARTRQSERDGRRSCASSGGSVRDRAVHEVTFILFGAGNEAAGFLTPAIHYDIQAGR